MLLQSTSSSSFPPQYLPLSSSTLYSQTSLTFHNLSVLLPPKNPRRNNLSVTRYIPHLYDYSKQNHQTKPTPKWSIIYRKISLMENPNLGSSSVLDQMEKEGHKVSRWELCRVVKELRKFRRFKLALEVYEWMTERGDRFTLSSTDAAIQLDLISKVHGAARTEEYFLRLPGFFKDKRTYGSLLNAYVQEKRKGKAECLMQEMNNKGYVTHPLPYNVMMTLYMKLKEYDKAILMVSEMMEKNISLDIYSYNIWLTACGAMGSMKSMEKVLQRMKLDSAVNPNWTTYSTMATMYMNLGYLEKARDSLRMVEGKITGRERIPFHYLLSLYGGIGEKEEVYRVWNTYKSSFPKIPNLGYHSMIASLVRLDDIEGAEKIYEEWLPLRSTYDPRICNLLIGWYVENGLMDKAEGFFKQVLEVGGKVNAYTWGILAYGHVKEQRIPEALSCMKEAKLTEGGKGWRPSSSTAAHFLFLCEQESDVTSKKSFIELLTQTGCLDDEVYRSVIRSNGNVKLSHDASVDKDWIGRDNNDECGADMLLNQLEESV